MVAQENPDKRVFVLDCDQHFGDGTAEFTTRLPNLYNFSINGTGFAIENTEISINMTLPRVTHNFDVYIKALQKGFSHIQFWRPDLIIYQAGADPHINDPLGTLGMTTEQLRLRDKTVFEFCKLSRIPLMFVLAGGYQEPIKERLIPLHVNTFKEAAYVYRN